MDQTVNWKEAIIKTTYQREYGKRDECGLCSEVSSCQLCICYEYGEAIGCAYDSEGSYKGDYCYTIFLLFWHGLGLPGYWSSRYGSPSMGAQPEFVRACVHHMLEWYEEEFNGKKET